MSGPRVGIILKEDLSHNSDVRTADENI